MADETKTDAAAPKAPKAPGAVSKGARASRNFAWNWAKKLFKYGLYAGVIAGAYDSLKDNPDSAKGVRSFPAVAVSSFKYEDRILTAVQNFGSSLFGEKNSGPVHTVLEVAKVVVEVPSGLGVLITGGAVGTVGGYIHDHYTGAGAATAESASQSVVHFFQQTLPDHGEVASAGTTSAATQSPSSKTENTVSAGDTAGNTPPDAISPAEDQPRAETVEASDDLISGTAGPDIVKPGTTYRLRMGVMIRKDTSRTSQGGYLPATQSITILPQAVPVGGLTWVKVQCENTVGFVQGETLKYAVQQQLSMLTAKPDRPGVVAPGPNAAPTTELG